MTAIELRKPPIDLLQQIDSAAIEPGSIALWHTGGAGYVVRTPAATIYVDPFCGESLDPGTWVRALAPAFDPSRVKRCDLVMSTHEHFDHCDPNALGSLREVTEASFVGPASSIAKAREWGWPDERLRMLAWGDELEVGDVRITTIKSVDPMAQGCNGYVFETQGLVLVNMGDSLWFDDVGKTLAGWQVDALCVSVAQNPVGGTYYMSEVDAVRMARDVGAKVLIPHHWDLWQWVLMDPRRIQAVAPWYAPHTQVCPARFGERMTLRRASTGVAVY